MLASAGGEAWLVLGDMRELGADAEALHAAAGRRAKAAGIARLYALGPLSGGDGRSLRRGCAHFAHQALSPALRDGMRGLGIADGARFGETHSPAPGIGLGILVKGSRGSAMDRVVAVLLGGIEACCLN